MFMTMILTHEADEQFSKLQRSLRYQLRMSN